MKKKFLITTVVCLVLGFVCVRKVYQALLVYDENLACEQELAPLVDKYSRLPYEINQLEIQLGIATSEAKAFIFDGGD